MFPLRGPVDALPHLSDLGSPPSAAKGDAIAGLPPPAVAPPASVR